MYVLQGLLLCFFGIKITSIKIKLSNTLGVKIDLEKIFDLLQKTVSEIFGAFNSIILLLQLKTAYFEMGKDGKFHEKTLPLQAQYSPVFTHYFFRL